MPSARPQSILTRGLRLLALALLLYTPLAAASHGRDYPAARDDSDARPPATVPIADYRDLVRRVDADLNHTLAAKAAGVMVLGFAALLERFRDWQRRRGWLNFAAD